MGKYFSSHSLKTTSKQAFTLVELIVVITILAILGTISFISLQSYTLSARDANRISQATGIQKALESYRINKVVPMPENSVRVEVNGNLIGYQGYFGTSGLSVLNASQGAKDPKDGSYFTYYISQDFLNYQLLVFLEERGGISLLNQSYAATNYTERIRRVYGDRLGVLTETSTNSPIQEVESIRLAGKLDIGTTTNTYTTTFSNNTAITGTGTPLLTAVTLYNKTLSSQDSNLVGFWNMETTKSGSTQVLKDFSQFASNGTSASTLPEFYGKSGKALKLNSNNYINARLGNSIGSNNNLTATAWVYTGTGTNGPIVGVTSSPPGSGWNMPFLSINGLTVYGQIRMVNGNVPLSFVTTEGRHHLAITYTPAGTGVEKFYVDDALVSSGSGQYQSAGATVYWSTYISGARPAGVNTYFSGTIDEVRVYKRVLSDEEINTMYKYED